MLHHVVTAIIGGGLFIEKVDTQIKSPLDYYNSITSSLSLFVTKPVDFFLELLVAAAFLCHATDFTLAYSSTSRWKLLPVLTAAALGYLFNNGLNSINVQVVCRDLSRTPRISTRDLAFARGFEDDDLARWLLVPLAHEPQYLLSGQATDVSMCFKNVRMPTSSRKP